MNGNEFYFYYDYLDASEKIWNGNAVTIISTKYNSTAKIKHIFTKEFGVRMARFVPNYKRKPPDAN